MGKVARSASRQNRYRATLQRPPTVAHRQGGALCAANRARVALHRQRDKRKPQNAAPGSNAYVECAASRTAARVQYVMRTQPPVRTPWSSNQNRGRR